jgi:hypothetical protein
MNNAARASFPHFIKFTLSDENRLFIFVRIFVITARKASEQDSRKKSSSPTGLQRNQLKERAFLTVARVISKCQWTFVALMPASQTRLKPLFEKDL